MNVESRFSRLIRAVGPAWALVPVGLILLIVGAIMLGSQGEKYSDTYGIITNVVEGAVEDGRQQYIVDYMYNMEGANHEGSFTDNFGDYKIGDSIRVFYDPERPYKCTTAKSGGSFAPVVLSLGLLAAAYGAAKVIKALPKLRRLKRLAAQEASDPVMDLKSFRYASGVTEYYFRFDGNSMLPGYLIEDADRKVLFEGKRLRSAVVGARAFEFTDHKSGAVRVHEVGHASAEGGSSASSFGAGFDFDGENIWDVLRGRGISVALDTGSGLPYPVYSITKEGAPFARAECSSIYVHEEDEAEHRDAVPYGKMYYRIWTDTDDIDTLFLTVFAISEC